MKVKLEKYEVLAAAQVGVLRQCQVLERKTACEAPWQAHVEAACAEMAFAKLAGWYWSYSAGVFRREKDVGNVQVRHTEKPDGRLIVTDADEDNDVFVLVRGRAPEFDVVGWAYGRDVKRRARVGGVWMMGVDGLYAMPALLARMNGTQLDQLIRKEVSA